MSRNIFVQELNKACKQQLDKTSAVLSSGKQNPRRTKRPRLGFAQRGPRATSHCHGRKEATSAAHLATPAHPGRVPWPPSDVAGSCGPRSIIHAQPAWAPPASHVKSQRQLPITRSRGLERSRWKQAAAVEASTATTGSSPS